MITMLNDLIRLIAAQLYQQPQLIEPRTTTTKKTKKTKKTKTCRKKKSFYE